MNVKPHCDKDLDKNVYLFILYCDSEILSVMGESKIISCKHTLMTRICMISNRHLQVSIIQDWTEKGKRSSTPLFKLNIKDYTF